MKVVIGVMLLVILASLFSALVFLLRDRGGSGRTVRALTWRIGLSIALFVLLIVASLMGWIQPHGVLSAP